MRIKSPQLTGHNPANPWDIRDAFAAAAIKLTSGGADGTYQGEWDAAMRYFSGSTNPQIQFLRRQRYGKPRPSTKTILASLEIKMGYAILAKAGIQSVKLLIRNRHVTNKQKSICYENQPLAFIGFFKQIFFCFLPTFSKIIGKTKIIINGAALGSVAVPVQIVDSPPKSCPSHQTRNKKIIASQSGCCLLGLKNNAAA